MRKVRKKPYWKEVRESCENGKKEIICKYEPEVTEYINVIGQMRVKIYNGSLKMKKYEIKRGKF